MLRKKRKKLPAKKDYFPQSFLGAFGLPYEPKAVTPVKGKVEHLVIKKPYGNGFVYEYLIAGNEADQQRVFMAASSRAVREGDDWVATFQGMRGLAKLAFGVENPEQGLLERTEKALINLEDRYMKFKYSFFDGFQNGTPTWRSRTVLLMEGYDYSKEKEFLKVYINPKFERLKSRTVLTHINQKVIARFTDDQFTRKLYMWLTSQFWRGKRILNRPFDKFVDELGIPQESSYSQWKLLKGKLPKAIDKINRLLAENKYQHRFFVLADTKSKKIIFTRKEK
jgi:hypothetical protein